MKHQLALACCRGWRQESFVNEAMRGPVPVWQDTYGRYYLGETGLPWHSFKGLRQRLTRHGFVVSQVHGLVRVTLAGP